MAVVLLSLVMHPPKHRCLCSHKLVTASAQFTTGTATEIPAEGAFKKLYYFENLATDSRKNEILQNFDKPKIYSSSTCISNKNTDICREF